MLEASLCNGRTAINRDSIYAYQVNSQIICWLSWCFFYKEGGGEFFATEPPSEGHTAYKCKKGGGLEPPAKLWCLRQQHSTSYMKFSAQVVHFYKILKLYIFYYKFKAIDYYFFNLLQLGKAIHKHRQTNRGGGCPPIIFNMISHVKILLNFTPYLNESMVLPPPP